MINDNLLLKLIKTARAKRGQRTIFAGGRRMTVHIPGEHVLYLPNGAMYKVTTDASGVATQVEGNDNLHAVVRPKPYKVNHHD